MQAEDGVLAFFLKYQYVILNILKDLISSLDTVTWTEKKWLNECEQKIVKNYSAWL